MCNFLNLSVDILELVHTGEQGKVIGLNVSIYMCDPFCENVPKVAKQLLRYSLKSAIILFLKQISKTYIFLIPYHSFTFVRSFKVLGSPCTLLKHCLPFCS